MPLACRKSPQQPTGPSLTGSATASAPASEPAQSADTKPADLPTSRPTKRFEVTSLTGPANQPLAMLGKIKPDKPAKIVGVLASDKYLVVDTENVSHLRLNLAALPRSKPDRLILRIDNQGIEIISKSSETIYLRRSTVGEWLLDH